MNRSLSLKKMLNSALIGAVAIAPLMGAVSVAQAAPNHSNPAWKVTRRGAVKRKGNNNRRPGNPAWNNRRDFQTFTGVVTKTKSGDEFDVKVDGKTYNVYLDGRRPRGLDKNDLVRVNGKRVGSNDIRNASVTVLRHR